MTLLRRLRLLSLLALFSGCGASDSAEVQQNSTASKTYRLTCDSPIGDVNTLVTYTVTASEDPVGAGDTVTFGINAPIAQVDSPITTTFVSSEVVFAVPAGFSVVSVATDSESTPDFTSAGATLEDGSIHFRLTGSFEMDGKTRPVPTVMVKGFVTAAAGETVVWTTPTVVHGKADAGIFGTQTSDCRFEHGGPISTVQVVKR